MVLRAAVRPGEVREQRMNSVLRGRRTGDAIAPLAVTVDRTQMFFFSAATYNGHRIHYDRDWATTVEGYDDVLVQGPLQSALLARALTDWIGGGGRLIRYSVQNPRPPIPVRS